MLWLLVSDYWIGESVYKAQLQWNAAGVGPAGSRRRARRVGTDGGKPSRDGCGLFAPEDADKKNTRVAEGTGAMSGMVGSFLGGSEACVRHAEGAGGGPFCFARC
jgi:hypothetical protein